MNAKEQQARRRELHALSTVQLRKLYASRTGRLLSEIRAMFDGLSDEGRQIMIDAIVSHESRSAPGSAPGNSAGPPR